MSRRTATTAVTALVLSAALIASPAVAEDPSAGVANVAHRGASAVAPENTLASVARAVAERADYVELDIRMTRDGVPVVLHDAGLARTTDVEEVYPSRQPWLVQDFTLAEIAALDAGTWQDPTYAGERVPTLAAVLDALRESPAGVFLEVKDPSRYGGVEVLGTKVYETLVDRWPAALAVGGAPRVRVQSFDADFIAAFAADHPEVPVSVTGGTVSPEAVTDFADDIQVAHPSATPELTADAHARGMTVGAWTVDETAVMTDLADRVDSITTNYPDLLRGVLAAQGDLFTGTAWPAKVSALPRWTVTTAGPYRNSPVSLRATLTQADGTPARWQRSAVLLWSGTGWTTLAERATDADGTFSVPLPSTGDITVQVATTDDWQFPLASSGPRDVALAKWPTTITVTGRRAIAAGSRTTLTLTWRAADGRAVSGSAKLFKRRPAGRWRFVRDLTVTDGHRRFTVSPQRTVDYRVRSRGGWWYAGARVDRRVRVLD